MRFVVVGAGAVGGVVGALLHRAGHEVVLVARGAHLVAIQRDGLRLRTPAEDVVLAVEAVGTVGEARWTPDTVVLLAVKSDATAGLLTELAAVVPSSQPVVCLQNGVANEPAALRWFAEVLGVCVMAPTGHLEPGVVEAACHPVAAILDVGRYPSGVDDLTRSVAAAFTSAGMVSEPRPDIMRWKYRKLLVNLDNAVQALCGSGPGTEELGRLLLEEAEAALAAAGIDHVSAEEDRARRGDILRRGEVTGSRRRGGSTWQSLARGTGAIESDWLNGEVVLLGRLHGVPTPANELLRNEAVRAAREGWSPGSVPAADLLARLSARVAP